MDGAFPEIPLQAWRPTKNTLHLYCQIIGKIRLTMHPRLNHWWHVPLYVTPRGLSTHTIPYTGGSFEIEFDFCEHVLRIRTSDKRVEDFALYDGLTVADFYSSVFANLSKLGIEPAIKAVPYEAPSTTPFAGEWPKPAAKPRHSSADVPPDGYALALAKRREEA